MRNEVAVRNGGEIQNNCRENYSVQEIAEKIFNDRHDDDSLFGTYEDDLKNGIEVEVKMHGKFRYCVIKDASKSKFNVEKGTILGVLSSDYDGAYGGYWPKGEKENIIATVSGKFKYEFSVFDRKGDNGGDFVSDLSRFSEHSVIIGKIFLPEFEFYQNNKKVIDEIVKNKEKEFEIKEHAKEAELKRNAEKFLKDQMDSIDDIDDLLKDLDKYILDNKLPVIEILQEINNDLKVLYAQKDNLNDIKSIKDFKSHFENAYKEAKKNPELTDIIEQRMLDILRTFYEILGESKDSINTKISEIKTAGNDKKFAVEFDEKLNTLNESITKLQSTFTNEKKLDFVQLETIEKISVDFEKQKKRINQKKLLERSKDSIESIFVEYIKLETKDGSAEKLLKRILKNFYLIFEKSEQQINEGFEKIKEKESERKFEIEFTELLNKIGDSITQILNSIETKSSIDFTHFQIIENSLSTLKSKKKEIKNLKMIEDNKSKFESIFDDCRKQNLLSQNSEKSMLEILNKFYDILDFSDEQKKKIQEARQKADEIREFENKVSEQNEAIKSISEKIRELEVIVENNEPVKIELFQTMEDSITQLAKRKDIIHDKAEIENLKVHFDAIFKDCKRKKNFSNSASLRMQEIEKGFNEIIGKKKNFLSVIFGK